MIDIGALVSAQRPGFALDQAFYRDSDIYQKDLERIFFEEWLLAGHVSDVLDIGDFFSFEIAGESVIIVRSDAETVSALVNVCRHRGSRVCLKERGTARRFVCPYHAWTYNLDGTLECARLIAEELDPEEWGLRTVSCKVYHGMIYISFSDAPTSFDEIERELTPLIAPFELAKTKIAYRASYPVEANWKLLVENYNECYHCASAHPEFSRSHSIHMTPDRVAPLNRAMATQTVACGLATDVLDRMADKRPPGSPDFAYDRYALFDGFETGSEDGKPVGPLLGQVKGYDSGASDIYVGMLNPMLVYCDHAVAYRFIPIAEERSIQEIIWFVHEDAVEGKDYDLARLTWLWDVTTVADKLIIEKNQEGVNSRFYRPGPYAPMESYTQRLVAAYLDAVRT
jgi:Rieske 2Fe-2S family protein